MKKIKFSTKANNLINLKKIIRSAKILDQITFTVDEYKEKIAALQTDKDGKVVCLYTNNVEEQLLIRNQMQVSSYLWVILLV